jgi:hypothetical protein
MTLAKNITAGFDRAMRFAVWAAVGGAIGNLISEPLRLVIGTSFFLTALWFGFIGASIGVALVAASSQYLKRGLQLGLALKNGLLPGLIAGAIAGAIAYYIYNLNATEFLRVICWGIAGGLLGLSLSFSIPNLGRLRGMGGGLVGGLVGGSSFVLLVVVSGLPNIVGRLIGSGAIGFCIGLAIAIIEVAFRQAWLEIRYNPREVRTVSLGEVPITIGSDVKACTVYVHNAPPVAFRYQLTQGQIVCEDIVSGTKRKLEPEDEQVLSNITIVVKAANSLPSTNNFPNASPKPIPDSSPSQFFLRIQKQDIELKEGTSLHPQHIPSLEPQKHDGVVAQVNRNPSDPSVLGLKNCSHQSWTVTLNTGEQRNVESGRSIKLVAGTKIIFGIVEGEIR